MSEQISSDFYKVPNVKIDILRLRTELEDLLKKKKFNTLGISHFGAISINRIPGDEESIKVEPKYVHARFEELRSSNAVESPADEVANEETPAEEESAEEAEEGGDE